MSTERPDYPPLNRRQKLVFALAAVAASGFALALALYRLWLIRWWVKHCDVPSSTCRAAEFGYTWWWIILLAGVLVTAWVAHRLTAERLITP